MMMRESEDLHETVCRHQRVLDFGGGFEQIFLKCRKTDCSIVAVVRFLFTSLDLSLRKSCRRQG
jgi:hypothetical protein